MQARCEPFESPKRKCFVVHTHYKKRKVSDCWNRTTQGWYHLAPSPRTSDIFICVSCKKCSCKNLARPRCKYIYLLFQEIWNDLLAPVIKSANMNTQSEKHAIRSERLWGKNVCRHFFNMTQEIALGKPFQLGEMKGSVSYCTYRH